MTVTSGQSKIDIKGLTANEAQLRLAADGPNELPRTGSRSALKIVGEVLREPMLALLLAGGVAYLVLGSRTEALILLSFALFSIALTVVQETRTEHVLEALRDLSAPRAMVVRDGDRVRIAGREVVQGAVIVSKDEAGSANVPPVVARSAVGAGDSFVGGATLALAQGKSLRVALASGVAAGTAAVLSPGAGLSHRDDVQRLYAELLSTITKIEY